MKKSNTENAPVAVDVPADEPVAVEVSPPAPTQRPVEHWAEAKGMLPEFFRSESSLFGLSNGRLNPECWRFRATKAFKRWPDGLSISESEFDAAVTEMEQQTTR